MDEDRNRQMDRIRKMLAEKREENEQALREKHTKEVGHLITNPTLFLAMVLMVKLYILDNSDTSWCIARK